MIEQELEGVRREFETYKKRSRLATVKLQQELEEKKKNQVHAVVLPGLQTSTVLPPSVAQFDGKLPSSSPMQWLAVIASLPLGG